MKADKWAKHVTDTEAKKYMRHYVKPTMLRGHVGDISVDGWIILKYVLYIVHKTALL
jgi:hypothetical protein